MTKPRAATTQGASERTPSETTALLVELGRAVKARSFYAEGEPEVRLLFARAWRSFQAHDEPAGPPPTIKTSADSITTIFRRRRDCHPAELEMASNTSRHG